MLHYLNCARISGCFRCEYCGDRVEPKCDGKWTPENFRDGPDYTIDKAKWLASPECCKIYNPLDISVFDRVEHSRSMGYRHDEEAIKIDDDTLVKRIKQFTPLVKHRGVVSRFDVPDLRGVAFTWEPKNLEEVRVLHEVMVTPTHHSCGYVGFFKPTIAEVLAQAPEGIDANAFYIDQSHILISRCGGGHLVKTHWVRI